MAPGSIKFMRKIDATLVKNGEKLKTTLFEQVIYTENKATEILCYDGNQRDPFNGTTAGDFEIDGGL